MRVKSCLYNLQGLLPFERLSLKYICSSVSKCQVQVKVIRPADLAKIQTVIQTVIQTAKNFFPAGHAKAPVQNTNYNYVGLTRRDYYKSATQRYTYGLRR